jgi:hypothetical protein
MSMLLNMNWTWADPGPFHLMYTPPPLPMDEVNKIWTPKKKDQSADTNTPPRN